MTLQRIAQVRQMAGSGEARRIRQAAKVSLSEIAGEVGVSLNAVWKWENGKSRPSGKQALRYLHVLNALERAVREPAA